MDHGKLGEHNFCSYPRPEKKYEQTNRCDRRYFRKRGGAERFRTKYHEKLKMC